MLVRRTAARLVLIAWVLTLPTLGQPASASTGAPAETSIELSLYTSHEEIIVRDAAGRVISREIHTADHVEPAPVTSSEIGTAADPRCTNGANYNYLFRDGQGVRTPRPWRVPETIAYSTANVPAGVSAYWRSAITNAALEWERGTNPCGVADPIAWRHTTAPDTTYALSSICSENNDDINTIGFTNLGGWGTNGLLLGRACMRATSSYYTQGDVQLNSHADAVWCNGACPNGWDLQSLVAHELGHYIGLGHVCNDGDLNNPCDTAAESSAVMYPWIDQNSTKNRSLSAGDLAGAQSLYPAAHAYEIVSVTLDDPIPGHRKIPGQTYAATVEIRNRGFEPWTVGAATALATEPAARCSAFVAPDWTSCSVPSALDDDVTNEAVSYWPNSAQVVIRDETARFRFQIAAPSDAGGISTIESFRPVAGGIRMPGVAVAMPVNVGSLDASVVRSAGPDVAFGSVMLFEDTVLSGPLRSTVTIEMRNDGTAPWPVGTPIITLRPAACSPFAADDWAACDNVGYVQLNLTDDGAPIARPGDVVRVEFAMTRGTPPAGRYEEEFSLHGAGAPFGAAAALRFTAA